MRAILTGLALVCSITSASAEVWRMREGRCGEWRSRWQVEQESSGVWTGFIEHEHVGGSCSPGGDTLARSEARAAIVGDNFFAIRRNGAVVCSYFGNITGDRVRGVELCDGRPRWDFSLRFPSPEDLDVQRPDPRQRDD